MYAVFPNEDKSDFYFVFDLSKTELRSQILENNKFAVRQRFCQGCSDQVNQDQLLQHSPKPVQIPTINDDEEPLSLKMLGSSMSPFPTKCNKESMPLNLYHRRSWNACLNLFKDGHVNENALQVLERVTELVKVQYDLLAGMANNLDPSLKYDASRRELMISSKPTHTGSSPNKSSKKGVKLH